MRPIKPYGRWSRISLCYGHTSATEPLAVSPGGRQSPEGRELASEPRQRLDGRLQRPTITTWVGVGVGVGI
jgi:hypothetical protein